jgi:hypothetical protein
MIVVDFFRSLEVTGRKIPETKTWTDVQSKEQRRTHAGIVLNTGEYDGLETI